MVQERFRKKNIAIDELQGQQRKKRLRRRIFYLALILLISAAFFAVCVLVFFNVGEIELVGLERCDAAAVREALGVSVGDNMFSFRAGDVESALKKAFPYIASAEVSRGFPTKLTVTVEEEKPAACVEQYGEYFVLSRDLKVLERLTDKPEGLLFLSTSPTDVCIVGRTAVFADQRVANTIVRLLDALDGSGILDKIVSVDMTNRFEIYFWYEDRFYVYMGTVDDAEIKTAFLVKVIEKLGNNRGTIDVSDTREASFSIFE